MKKFLKKKYGKNLKVKKENNTITRTIKIKLSPTEKKKIEIVETMKVYQEIVNKKN